MGEQKIADVGPWKVRSDSNLLGLGNPKDDATLMSASKDMLEALEALVDALGKCVVEPRDCDDEDNDAVFSFATSLMQAKAAIKKARGQT
jgi:hypothetical protein